MDENTTGRKKLRVRERNTSRIDSNKIPVCNRQINGQLRIKEENSKQRHDDRNNSSLDTRTHVRLIKCFKQFERRKGNKTRTRTTVQTKMDGQIRCGQNKGQTGTSEAKGISNISHQRTQ